MKRIRKITNQPANRQTDRRVDRQTDRQTNSAEAEVNRGESLEMEGRKKEGQVIAMKCRIF